MEARCAVPYNRVRILRNYREKKMPNDANRAEPRVQLREGPLARLLGGEVQPYDYPHLHQIRAGDWRISYAVERNRLAILVLEVLSADGQSDQARAHNLPVYSAKVRLLDGPNASPGRDLAPSGLRARDTIRFLDVSDEPHSVPRRTDVLLRNLKLRQSVNQTAVLRPRILLRKPLPSTDLESPAVIDILEGRLVTPLHSPTQ